MENSAWKIEVLLAGSWRGATSVLLSNGNQRLVVDTGLPHEAHQLVKALDARNLRPADITAVVNTHFHVDHVLNNVLFPGVPIYASQQSYEWCRALYADLSNELNWEKLVLKYYPETFDYEKAREHMVGLRKFALRWWDPKRLGAPPQFRWIETQTLPEGLEGMVTWGHVPGHLSLVIRTSQLSTVIAGDALLSREHEEHVATMIPHDRARFQLERQRLLSLGEDIVPGHDRGFSTVPSPENTASDTDGGASPSAGWQTTHRK